MNLGDLDEHMEKIDQNKKTLDRVKYCVENCTELNDWEDAFLTSIQDQLMGGRILTERQVGALERIEYLVSWGRDSYWEEFGRGDR